jgi:tRNA modification GTPase
MGRGSGDEVVAVVVEGQPPEVEIHCHGGPVVMDLVVDALRAAGAEIAEPADWAAHESPTPLRAAALVELARAPTLRAAEILLEQSQGALDRELTRLAEEIRAGSPAGARRLERLLERGRVGVRLTNGWRVVICGRPNVGKSRLLNALAGYMRAIVDPAPGTTRDVVSVATAFDGWPVELADTAGVRPTDDALERLGIERALRQAEAADLVLKVLDRSQPLQDDDLTLIRTAAPALLVASKADLPAVWELPDALFGSNLSVSLSVSAQTGEGLESLIDAIVAALVPVPPEPTAGVPFRPVDLDRLRNVHDALQAGDAAWAISELEVWQHAAQGVGRVARA